VYYLLKERRFLPLFLTQFFGAFNDNAFKLSMLTLISYHLTQNQAQSEYYQAMAGALYILPFFILSATSGQLADKYDKALLTRLVKAFEVILMMIGGLALYRGSIILMMTTLTGMGVHSTFFGPIKYAILPDHLRREDLLGATGLIEASTFLAILLGTTLGALSISTTSAVPYLAIYITLTAAFAGLISSVFIPSAPPTLGNSFNGLNTERKLKIDFHLWRATMAMLKQVKEERSVLLAIITISWFWLIGAIILTKLPDYAHYVLGADTSVFAFFLALFSIGIALGSLMINRILKGRITVSIVPYAMFVLTCFTIDLYWASPQAIEVQQSLIGLLTFFSSLTHWRIAFDLFMLAFSAGLFIVPLYTFLQVASDPQNRARTIAANNIYNALFMVIGTFLVMILLHFSMTIPQVFLIMALLNLIVAVFLWFCWRLQPREYSVNESTGTHSH
jgi:MFS family permease